MICQSYLLWVLFINRIRRFVSTSSCQDRDCHSYLWIVVYARNGATSERVFRAQRGEWNGWTAATIN